jgi:hypothetical protein
MYNKTIIGFGFRMTLRIIQTSVNVILLSFASADNIDLCLNNSWYHAQPHPIIVYYTIFNFPYNRKYVSKWLNLISELYFIL